MIPIETMGRPSWPKRVRQFLGELFGSRYIAHLERELLQAKVERDRVISELRAENRELLNRLLAASRIAPVITARPDDGKKTSLPPTRWEQIQAQAIADNARAEAEEAAKQKPKEN
jgi:hypothetical protein